MNPIDIPPPFNEAWFRAILGFIVGIILGSFITMLSYRLPRKLSITLPPSSCPHCHKTLQIRDLVPVVSWLIAHGKCRFCGAEIGARYVWIEIATGVASAVAFAWLSFQPTFVIAVLAIITVITMVTIRIERD